MTPQQINFYLEGNIMEITIREYSEKDLEQMIEIWNEVIDSGIAFPQIEKLTQCEAAVFFGMSKGTIYRLIKSNRISAHNFGERLTRVCKSDLESMFTVVKIAPDKEKIEEKQVFEIGTCYTISEISAKYHADPGTVNSVIKRNKIPTKKVGSFVYAPKNLIDKIFDGK